MKTRLLLLAAILTLVCMPLACTESTGGVKVTTVGVFEVYGDGATLTGKLGSTGEFSRVAVWFNVKSSTTSLGDTPIQTLTAPGEFTYRLTGLDQDTTYTFTAHAKGDTSSSDVQGEELDFNIAELTGG
jgi:hypothetical protein